MAIIQRRIFFGKVGSADRLVNHIKEGEKALQGYGVSINSRILTDYMSGRTDRVVSEWEVSDPREIESAMDAAMSNPEAQTFFVTWLEELNDLIHHAEVENWAIR